MIKAIIWDYDGTLVDTRQKNLNVTKGIVLEVLQKEAVYFSALKSIQHYQEANSRSANWRDLYANEFAMNEEQVNYAGSLWTKYQLLDKTETIFYEGLDEIIREFGNTYLQGIVSLNSQENIRKNLNRQGLDGYFNEIVGYEEVEFTLQKPDPAALIKCMSNLKLDQTDDVIIYIGDHETDAHCAFNTNTLLRDKRIVSIGALYEKDYSAEKWIYQPDYIASTTNELMDIIRSLDIG